MTTKDLIASIDQTKENTLTFEEWMRAIRLHAQMQAVAEMEHYLASSDDQPHWREEYEAGETPRASWAQEQESW